MSDLESRDFFVLFLLVYSELLSKHFFELFMNALKLIAELIGKEIFDTCFVVLVLFILELTLEIANFIVSLVMFFGHKIKWIFFTSRSVEEVEHKGFL